MSANNAKLRTTLLRNGPQADSRIAPEMDEESDEKHWRPDIFPPAVSTSSSKTPKDAPPMTIDEFCKRYALSRSHYFELKQQGRNPVEFRVGRKTLITTGSARDWERRMQAKQSGVREPRSKAKSKTQIKR